MKWSEKYFKRSIPLSRDLSINTKALRKTEFTELFVFPRFGIVLLPKFGNFLKISCFFYSRKFHENSSEISSGQKTLFLRQKQGFWGQKRENRGFRTFQIYRIFGICSIPNFPKITKKMTLKLNFENCKKLVLTQILTRTFKFKFGMQGLNLIPMLFTKRWLRKS